MWARQRAPRPDPASRKISRLYPAGQRWSGRSHKVQSPEQERNAPLNKLANPLATLAVAAAASAVLTTAADARGGHRGHFHFRHIHVGPPIFHRYEEPERVYRKPRVVKPAVVATPAPVVKFADGEGRMFDRASKTWFDGAGACWKGSKSFAFRSGSWFYGDARWVQTSTGWGVSSGELPEQVDCTSVKAFAGKIKPVASASEAPANEEVKPAAAKQAPVRTVAPAPAVVAPKAPEATANASDCKKYLPSLGETVSVPCTQ